MLLLLQVAVGFSVIMSAGSWFWLTCVYGSSLSAVAAADVAGVVSGAAVIVVAATEVKSKSVTTCLLPVDAHTDTGTHRQGGGVVYILKLHDPAARTTGTAIIASTKLQPRSCNSLVVQNGALMCHHPVWFEAWHVTKTTTRQQRATRNLQHQSQSESAAAAKLSLYLLPLFFALRRAALLNALFELRRVESAFHS